MDSYGSTSEYYGEKERYLSIGGNLHSGVILDRVDYVLGIRNIGKSDAEALRRCCATSREPNCSLYIEKRFRIIGHTGSQPVGVVESIRIYQSTTKAAGDELLLSNMLYEFTKDDLYTGNEKFARAGGEEMLNDTKTNTAVRSMDGYDRVGSKLARLVISGITIQDKGKLLCVRKRTHDECCNIIEILPDPLVAKKGGFPYQTTQVHDDIVAG